jgi:hypothetical protein
VEFGMSPEVGQAVLACPPVLAEQARCLTGFCRETQENGKDRLLARAAR